MSVGWGYLRISGPYPCLGPMGIRVSFSWGAVSLVWRPASWPLGTVESSVRTKVLADFAYLGIRDSDMALKKTDASMEQCCAIKFCVRLKKTPSERITLLKEACIGGSWVRSRL